MDIDLVYTWCDAADDAWRAKKAEAARAAGAAEAGAGAVRLGCGAKAEAARVVWECSGLAGAWAVWGCSGLAGA